ncbi:hotdog domain-containing protein [Rhodococcus sp. ACT016]|uniref:PaaI family thioesterase n=1 Tax=Rhodococcus sp. ACT016 TaxID=3134808 RepID=UPI003D295B47
MNSVTVAPRGIDPLNTVMGVRTLWMNAAGASFEQSVGPRFHDHRGLTTLGSVGVVADDAVAGAFYVSAPEGSRTVVSQLVVTAAAPLPTAGTVTAAASTAHLDLATGTGVTHGEIRDAQARVAAVLHARSFIVSRPTRTELHYGPAAELVVPEPEEVTPVDELAAMPGLAIVEGIASGRVHRGPLAGLTELTVATVARGTISGLMTPRTWMSNAVGTVQGGVLLSVADLAAGLVAQTLTEPGTTFRTLDAHLDLVRSPAVDGPPILVEADVVRAGRRLALIETRLSTPDGHLLVSARASAQLGQPSGHPGR